MEAKLRLIVLLSIILIGCGPRESKCDINPDACPVESFDAFEVFDIEEHTFNNFGTNREDWDNVTIPIVESFQMIRIFCESDQSTIMLVQESDLTYTIYGKSTKSVGSLDEATRIVCDTDNLDLYAHRKYPIVDVNINDMAISVPDDLAQKLAQLSGYNVTCIFRCANAECEITPVIQELYNKYGLQYVRGYRGIDDLIFEFQGFIVHKDKLWNSNSNSQWIMDKVHQSIIDDYNDDGLEYKWSDAMIHVKKAAKSKTKPPSTGQVE